MKWLAAISIAFFGLIGWMRKYTGIAFLMLVTVFCLSYFKADIIQLMRESAQRQEAKELRQEKAVEAERERAKAAAEQARLDEIERKKEASAREAKALAEFRQGLALAEAKVLMLEREAQARVLLAKENQRIAEMRAAAAIKKARELEATPPPKFDLASAVDIPTKAYCRDTSLTGYIRPHGYSGKTRFVIEVSMINDMVKAVKIISEESFPVMSTTQVGLMRDEIEAQVARWDCKGTGSIQLKYTFTL